VIIGRIVSGAAERHDRRPAGVASGAAAGL